MSTARVAELETLLELRQQQVSEMTDLLFDEEGNGRSIAEWQQEVIDSNARAIEANQNNIMAQEHRATALKQVKEAESELIKQAQEAAALMIRTCDKHTRELDARELAMAELQRVIKRNKNCSRQRHIRKLRGRIEGLVKEVYDTDREVQDAKDDASHAWYEVEKARSAKRNFHEFASRVCDTLHDAGPFPPPYRGCGGPDIDTEDDLIKEIRYVITGLRSSESGDGDGCGEERSDRGVDAVEHRQQQRDSCNQTVSEFARSLGVQEVHG